MANLICSFCQKEFYSSHKERSKYCSRICYRNYQWSLIPTYDLLYTKYCEENLSSYEIAKELNTDSQTIQRWLKKLKIKTRNLKDAGLVSYKKFPKRKAGELNPNWKGGITPENVRVRTSADYLIWRQLVFQRDNYTCQKCKKTKGYLHAHHIKSFAKFKELRTELSNGITLCKQCHKKEHARNK